MGSIAIFLQQHDGIVSKSALSSLQAARELQTTWAKEKIVGLCLGKGAAKAADEALKYGVTTAYFSEAAGFEKYRAAPYAQALADVARQAGSDTIVAASTSTGKDFIPRVAAAFDAGQASDVIAVNNDGSLKRPMYAGNVLADVEITTPTKVVTVRPTAFAPAQPAAGGGQKQELSIQIDESIAGEIVGYEAAKSERPELGDAGIVVSGGRALQSKENFEKFIFPLADALGAAIGASRAAVDAGYAPNDWQVGQTGKVVAPSLYIAIGISGAIQHLAGMKDAKTIVAINKDGDAPIFELADYGLVGDLYEIIPALTELVKKAKS